MPTIDYNKEGWIACVDFLPPDGLEVDTKIDDVLGDRNRQLLTRRGRLWFTGDTYVYYEPTHWRKIPKPQHVYHHD